ncbi:MAG: DUF6502 family protein [Geminicoccaceae bacterium]
MRPIIKLMVARGVQLPAVTAALKQIYVDVATNDFKIGDKPLTDSRVSVLTGVHRRDVRSIRKDGMPSSLPPPMSLSATVIGRWLGDPAYADEKGQPRPLHRLADDGSPSFEELFQHVSKDIHPRTILDDLINQELVDWDQKSDLVRLRSRAFVPAAGGEDAMRFFEMNLHDHLAAAVSNLLKDEQQGRFLERAVYYNELTLESVEKIEGDARKLGEQVLKDLNSTAFQLQKDDGGSSNATERFRFGVFFYREDEKAKGDPS